MSEKLEPCPFCKGEAKIVEAPHTGTKKYAVSCGTGGCMAYVGPYLNKSAAIAAWNRRPAPEANEALTIDELRGMDGKPVWIDDWWEDFHGWELSADASDYIDGRDTSKYGGIWKAYRRPPDGGEG